MLCYGLLDAQPYATIRANVSVKKRCWIYPAGVPMLQSDEMTGMYFIASDGAYDLVIAFLNSVRCFEPLMPVCLIPYNGDCARIASLASVYGFSIWEDTGALERCDAISERFHGKIVGQYRKLAMWDGPFSEFVYVDIDTLILGRFEYSLRLLEEYDVITGTSNLEGLRKYVWKGGIEEILPDLDTKYSANTGFIVSKRGCLALADMEKRVEECLPIKGYMALECTEQPLLNYLIVTSGVSYSSLTHLRRSEGRRDLPGEVWGGMFDDDLLSSRVPIQFVHWAGIWQKGMHLKSATWRHFRSLRDDL